MSDQWQYLVVPGLCPLITLPLEVFGKGVYRQPGRVLRAVVPFAAVFLVWDAIAIAAGIWWYNGKYITGIELPPRIPIEEVLFFLVIPVCGLLTYGAVSTILARSRRR